MTRRLGNGLSVIRGRGAAGVGILGACDPAGYPIPGAKPGEETYGPSPWIEAPKGRVPFDEIGSVATPNAGAAEAVVHQFQVPTGLDGVIYGIVTRYIPGGLAPASGNLIWKLRHGKPGIVGTPVRNYANITVEWGDFSSYHEIYGGIPMVSEEFFTLTILNAPGSPLPGGAANLTVAGVNGYYWPRERK